MSVTDLLHEAFSNKDWGKVSDAYEQMTGKALISEESPKKPDFISPSKQPSENSEARKEGRAKSEPIQSTARENSFVDDGTIAPEESVSVNPELGVPSPVVRGKRETPEKVSVVCSRCNQTELVLNNLVGNLSTYRCNNCCVNK